MKICVGYARAELQEVLLKRGFELNLKGPRG